MYKKSEENIIIAIRKKMKRSELETIVVLFVSPHWVEMMPPECFHVHMVSVASAFREWLRTAAQQTCYRPSCPAGHSRP